MMAGFRASGAPVPIDYFALRPAIQNVSLSPDGKHIAMRRLFTKDGNYVIEVYDTAHMDKKPVRFGAKKMEIVGYQWASPDYLWVTFTQQVRKKIQGVNRGVFELKSALVHISGKKPWKTLPDDARLFDVLVNEPNKIRIYTSNYYARKGIEGKAISDLNTPDFYDYDLRSGRQHLVLKGNDRLGGYVSDAEGNIRGASELDMSKREIVYYTRGKEKGSKWREFLRYKIEDYDKYGQLGIRILGFDPEDENKALVLAHNEHDKAGVYLIDLNTGKFLETVYQRNDVDVQGGLYTPDADKPSVLSGFWFYKDGKQRDEFIDGRMAAIQKSVDAAFPQTRNTVSSCADDCRLMVVFTQSSQDPGTYYLISNGKAAVLGKRNPLVKKEDLGKERFVHYPARDGMDIPAILTMPASGKPPYPLIVLPHGGPWVSETRAYDEWVGLLTNHGYMVLQPQYRGSEGYGIRHWSASFGQWGKTMSDDLDDGVAYLVKQGLADPDRVALFGWSYGGYAAMAGSERKPQIYQCVVAGAGVSDIDKIRSD
ncbi:MAG TPA: S9 family peptidase, partial [Rhizobiales bacterium]|nr:S9 family peptidase [Hyphomicrobiales bacterium]